MAETLEALLLSLAETPVAKWFYTCAPSARNLRNTQKYSIYLPDAGASITITRIKRDTLQAASIKSWNETYFLSVYWDTDQRDKIFEREDYIIQEKELQKTQSAKSSRVKKLFDLLEGQRILVN